MYCSCSNYFGPNEFGYHVVLDFVLGTFEMHSKLVSFKEGVFSTLLIGAKHWMIMKSYLLHQPMPSR